MRAAMSENLYPGQNRAPYPNGRNVPVGGVKPCTTKARMFVNGAWVLQLEKEKSGHAKRT